MNKDNPPKLIIAVNLWSLTGQPPGEENWSVARQLKEIGDAGFEAVTCHFGKDPDLARLVEDSSLRYGGFFDAGKGDDYARKIAKSLEIGDGPMNCQLGDHDTPVKEAVEMAILLMEAAEELKADVFLEVHRDTCTETPEKSYAIAESFEKKTGKLLPMNFDFSHPATVKHLGPANYTSRLFERIDLFQYSYLWHFRPFNGHHCQIPVTDGKGNFSPEYESLQPFIRDAFRYWLEGTYDHEEFWVVPELGPVGGYGLSCFPNIWEDTVALGNDLKAIWKELTGH